MAVVGLLGFSALLPFTRSCLVKILVLLGFLILSYVRHFPVVGIPALTNHAFFETLAVIGGLVYLIGADQTAPKPSSIPASKPKRQ